MRERPVHPETEVLRARTAAYAALVAESHYRKSERERLSRDRALGASQRYALGVLATLQGAFDRIGIMESSKFWLARNRWFALKKRLGISKIGPMEKFTIGGPHPDFGTVEDAYDQWLRNHALRDSDCLRIREVVPLLPYKPVISVIMPTYNTPVRYLRDAIDSVREQLYPYWELCIADDASTDERTRDVLAEYAILDERIKIRYQSENGHISKASNAALDLATGDFIALLDHDDMLVPEAFYEVAVRINAVPDVDYIYSDEDKINQANARSAPFFKPDWSPEWMLSVMYTCHLSVYRRSIVEEVGRFRSEYDGSQDWDLVLRVTERTDRIAHIPKVLYSWRIHPASAASGSDAKPFAYLAAKRALEDALRRRNEEGEVKPVPDLPPGTFVVRYKIVGEPLVDILIPTRDAADLLKVCLGSIFERSTYKNFRVNVIDNGSVKDETFDLFEAYRQKEPLRFRTIRDDRVFNFSAINNHAATYCDGEYLLFLNNDTAVVATGWIEALLELAQRPGVGCVGAKLLYEDETIQHAGVILGIGGIAGHSHRMTPGDAEGHYNAVKTVRNYVAVTAACMLVSRDLFNAVGGFDEQLAVAFNDVDLCLRVHQAGYRNVYTPYAELFHYESKSRGYDDNLSKVDLASAERAIMLRRWGEIIENDPYYSPHYTRVYENFQMRVRD
jgi:GT2 family glycosyltransferase